MSFIFKLRAKVWLPLGKADDIDSIYGPQRAIPNVKFCNSRLFYFAESFKIPDTVGVHFNKTVMSYLKQKLSLK